MHDKLRVWWKSSKAKICCSKSTLLKVDSLSTISNYKLIAQSKKLKTSAQLRIFEMNVLSPYLKRQYTRYSFIFLIFHRL